jgi:energy-coupling factor transporter ATP-binding protein EcfA2
VHYKRFVIKDYRAIIGPLEIKLDKAGLTPIVGVNESGKTTILHALFAFDHLNDDLNDGGRHLKDVTNLYRTSPPRPWVIAEIALTKTELKRAAEEGEKNSESQGEYFRWLQRRTKLPDVICIHRDLSTRKYQITPNEFGSVDEQDSLARQIILQMPYILYFDDFRDKIPERIPISTQEEGSSGWTAIIEQLFKQTNPSFSIHRLAALEDRQRKSVLAKVERTLNDTLTREWQTFKLDDRDALRIKIGFDFDNSKPAKCFIRLDVVETDVSGDEHYFYISDRSKGFYWFFNFVMKLEFNPKLVANQSHSIYLLDEPGSYLHALAQRKLCSKLSQISERNWVAYCTHSHYLLDPAVIPVNRIKVAQKDGNGSVELVPIASYDGATQEKRSALQPVLDALQIQPFALDLIGKQLTIITEGIYDYFAIELFRNDRPVSVLPSVGADSIKFYISLMIAWQVDFRALWDNDPEGRDKHDRAAKFFGETIATRHLKLLPSKTASNRRIMQNLFDGQDLTVIRSELGLAADCSFERTLHALFYSKKRSELVNGMGDQTKRNFTELFDSLALD